MHTSELYSMVPIYNNEVFIDTDAVFRTLITKNVQYVDILEYLKVDASDNYITKKARFINKWKFVNLLNLEQSLCDFGTKFHIKFLEDIITYVFNIWTKAHQKKDENHAFYMKMLYFYDLQKLVAWAHLIDEKLQSRYTKFITPVSLKLLKQIDDFESNSKSASKEKGKALKEEEKNESKKNESKKNESKKNESNKNESQENKKSMQNNINLLISTLNKSNKEWISTNLIKEFESNVSESEKLFDNIYKKTTAPKKVRADLLPVGHYLEKTSRFYHPDSGWFSYTTEVDNRSVKENSIIIGYDKRSKTGMSIKFKLRNPIQKIKQYNDIRSIEKGSVCNTKPKGYLRDLAKQLDIKLDVNIYAVNADDICSKIRNRLIYLELKERSKGSNIKYFYNVLEDIDI